MFFLMFGFDFSILSHTSMQTQLSKMPYVIFTPNLQRHIDCPSEQVEGNTVKTALDAVFLKNPSLKHYVLDDQERLRKHMLIAVDGVTLCDRVGLSDPVSNDSEIYVLQALSGG